ncbi:putative peptidyl-tRNA hydrolase [Aspergillus sclerotiicarbonarius CBS 121057]|uniref:Putative peptidyl-tRNA hydrolase n=1 Tax=Aspergillus sclerotiicarbonarius (strain CBS 121057 / IBT 28362) TaxID=1448318 RepID=A0A319ESP6_ASPSB|nr:putative peptidyl-tRNA hydrolase [Aspergillus sclerotiicarbonarius CBS 121057]
MSPATPPSPTTLTLKTPRRFLFIASIGNPRPYRQTRHSAGHILLEALVPLLPARAPLISSLSSNGPLFYKTWHSPSYMNESGPKLLRQFQSWLSSTQTETFKNLVQRGHVRAVATPDHQTPTPEWQIRGVDPGSLRQFSPTLVILHDELEAPLGKVRVKRGGPEKASLRGHRGLISAFESLRGKGLYPPKKGAAVPDLSVLRIGVGIGRPETRNRGDVADYVLKDMSPAELAAVRAAAAPVMEVLADELYWEGGDV